LYVYTGCTKERPEVEVYKPHAREGKQWLSRFPQAVSIISTFLVCEQRPCGGRITASF
jgi:hypothetical protein